MRQACYWSTSRQFPVQNGEPLEIGRWGRLFRELPLDYGRPFHYTCELVYETVWLRYYAEQISRLEAFFFFDNLDWATNFAKGEPVYEIAPLDPAAKIERHIIEDYGSLLYPQDLEGRPATTIAAVEKNAHRYWNYAPRPQMTTELLTKGPVKVIRKI